VTRAEAGRLVACRTILSIATRAEHFPDVAFP
jgi:hypothetical protein